MIARSQSASKETSRCTLPLQKYIQWVVHVDQLLQINLEHLVRCFGSDVDDIGFPRFSGYLVHLQGNSRPKNNEFRSGFMHVLWFFRIDELAESAGERKAAADPSTVVAKARSWTPALQPASTHQTKNVCRGPGTGSGATAAVVCCCMACRSVKGMAATGVAARARRARSSLQGWCIFRSRAGASSLASTCTCHIELAFRRCRGRLREWEARLHIAADGCGLIVRCER